MPGAREPIFSTGLVDLTTDYKDATFDGLGRIDKLDITISDGDALMQFKTVAGGEWVPDSGIYLKSGLFVSLPGVSEVHRHAAGVDGFRLKRAPGIADSKAEAKAWLR